jgi:hypothetical protein
MSITCRQGRAPPPARATGWAVVLVKGFAAGPAPAGCNLAPGVTRLGPAAGTYARAALPAASSSFAKELPLLLLPASLLPSRPSGTLGQEDKRALAPFPFSGDCFVPSTRSVHTCQGHCTTPPQKKKPTQH